jgi:hypothetical protein
VLVAINNELEITCKILESLEDILQAQEEEGDDYRDISDIIPLTFEGVLHRLRASAEKWSAQDPSDYSYG